MNWLTKAQAAQGSGSGSQGGGGYLWNWLRPNSTQGQAQGETITNLADKVITWVAIVAAVLAVLYLIYSGILYITAAGNPDAAKKGQQGVINAIIGIIIIVLAYFIATSIASFANTGTT